MKKELYKISLKVERISDRLNHFSSEEASCIMDLATQLNELIILLLREEDGK